MNKQQQQQIYDDIKSQGFTNAEVCKELGKRSDYIYRLCNKNKKITIEPLIKIYAIIGVSEGWAKIMTLK